MVFWAEWIQSPPQSYVFKIHFNIIYPCNINIIWMNKPRMMRWEGQVARMGKEDVGKPKGQRLRRWEDSIEMNLKELGRGGVYWVYLAQNRDKWRTVVNVVMNLRVP